MDENVYLVFPLCVYTYFSILYFSFIIVYTNIVDAIHLLQCLCIMVIQYVIL